MDRKYKKEYLKLDMPEILCSIFYPRSEDFKPPSTKNMEDLLIPVDDNISLGARFYYKDKKSPTILFFHGNGEIVADYHDIAPVYTGTGVNFLPVDYRGYGKSTGKPTVTGMMNDCHHIFRYVKNKLIKEAYDGPLIIMGRSLGSASALEIAANYEKEIDGLVIESGFAYLKPLLKILGINITAIDLSEHDVIANIDNIKNFYKPALIIHAEHDHIIPFSDGQALYDTCPSKNKQMLKIPGANHNTIFAVGLNMYMAAIKEFAHKLQ